MVGGVTVRRPRTTARWLARPRERVSFGENVRQQFSPNDTRSLSLAFGLVWDRTSEGTREKGAGRLRGAGGQADFTSRTGQAELHVADRSAQGFTLRTARHKASRWGPPGTRLHVADRRHRASRCGPPGIRLHVADRPAEGFTLPTVGTGTLRTVRHRASCCGPPGIRLHVADRPAEGFTLPTVGTGTLRTVRHRGFMLRTARHKASRCRPPGQGFTLPTAGTGLHVADRRHGARLLEEHRHVELEHRGVEVVQGFVPRLVLG